MKVCFFGIYDPIYSRNRILMNGLRENGYDIVECRVDPGKYARFEKYKELIREYKRIKNEGPFEHVVVAFPGHSVVWLAWILFGKNIIWDAYISLFDVHVFDRKKYRLFSWGGFKSWFQDWISGILAGRILFDTQEHINYFQKTFHLKKEKFIRVFIGADDSLFYPYKKEHAQGETLVHFHGSFIPVQGMEVILEAAKALRDEAIHFRLIGGGPLEEMVMDYIQKNNLSNVERIERVPFNEIPDYIAEADICLGIFGTPTKTQRVIANKVYECAAVGKPIISANTPAMRELFVNKVSAYLIPAGDAGALVDAIRVLKQDEKLRERMGRATGRVFEEYARPRIIVDNLLKEL